MEYGTNTLSETSSIRIAQSRRPGGGWDFGPFLSLAEAGFDGQHLHVTFANGDCVVILPECLTKRIADWTNVQVIDDAYLEAPGPDGPIEVPGFRIREVSHQEFGNSVAWSMRYTVPAIAQRLRQIREEQGVGLRDLARRIGMQPSNLLRIETGQREPGIRTVAGILGALGVGWDALTIDAESKR